MSLTEGEHVFAGIHEDGINDFVTAFFMARPRHLNYGTSLFVPVTTVNDTNMPTIDFPGIPGGIHYAVQFSIPQIDIVPATLGGPLPPGPGQLSLFTTVEITVGCGRWRRQPGEQPTGRPDISYEPVSTTLELWARGNPIITFFGLPGTGQAEIDVDEVEIVDIRPDSLESVLECIIRMILQAVLTNFRVPFNALTAGAFSLALLRFSIEEDQIKLYGDV